MDDAKARTSDAFSVAVVNTKAVTLDTTSCTTEEIQVRLSAATSLAAAQMRIRALGVRVQAELL